MHWQSERSTMSRLLAVCAALFMALSQTAFAVEVTDPDNTLVIETDSGEILIQLLPQIAPQHVARVKALAAKGAYDGVAFHRVIPGFMAQTGDVQHGQAETGSSALRRAGTGGSDMPDVPAEFSGVPFERGIVGAARSQSPNSANSQFFIMFAAGHFLNGQYTVWGQVIDGMSVVDAIQKGEPPASPTRMVKVRLYSAK
jgi:peptidylprolyl isomerase